VRQPSVPGAFKDDVPFSLNFINLLGGIPSHYSTSSPRSHTGGRVFLLGMNGLIIGAIFHSNVREVCI
jgi:hypothetical protein